MASQAELRRITAGRSTSAPSTRLTCFTSDRSDGEASTNNRLCVSRRSRLLQLAGRDGHVESFKARRICCCLAWVGCSVPQRRKRCQVRCPEGSTEYRVPCSRAGAFAASRLPPGESLAPSGTPFVSCDDPSFVEFPDGSEVDEADEGEEGVQINPTASSPAQHAFYHPRRHLREPETETELRRDRRSRKEVDGSADSASLWNGITRGALRVVLARALQVGATLRSVEAVSSQMVAFLP